MLFIYRVLPIGGIETFFLRMARERSKKGLSTTILLLSDPKDSNEVLLFEIKKYAKVIFYFDIFYKIPFLSKYFPLISVARKKELSKILLNVNQIHAFKGMHALLAYKLLSIASKKTIPITIGFYHHISYTWGGKDIAYHEKINRKFAFNYLPKESLLFFSKDNRDFHSKVTNIDFRNSKTFRLGVVDNKKVDISGNLDSVLKIVALGRLVEFKTYNISILEVIKQLVDDGILVKLDIFGEGPLATKIKKKIDFLNLENFVSLKGNIEYKEFDKIIKNYDLFIGSGTSIVQASSLGVTSIVGVDNETLPKTYGFFSNVHQHEYNLKGLKIKEYQVYDLIIHFLNISDEERYQLKLNHLNCSRNFSNEFCQNSMENCKNIRMPTEDFSLNFFKYETSRAIDQLLRFLNPKHPFNMKFNEFRN